MTTRYTQDEWLQVIKDAEQALPVTNVQYKAPLLGSEDFSRRIDHTLLKPEATKEQIDQICQEAIRDSFYAVCVRLKWVDRAVSNLKSSNIGVACVVGFHEGTQSTSIKVKEAREAVASSATEVDMVINWPLLKEKRYSEVYTDVAAVRSTAPHPVLLKVILETSQLNRHQIIAGCKIAEAARADFVKTSTGFNGSGATTENVGLMKSVVGASGMKVKASGGVKTVNECVAMMEAGADRIGTSSGVWIINEALSLLDQVTHDASSGRGHAGMRPSAALTRVFSSSEDEVPY